MEKNYYEILEVDKHASSDIIKKAYTTLAKKYHPDLQPDDQKEDAKKKLQKINEAYETLGNIEKKKIYDSLLEDSFVSKKEYDSLYVENQHLKQLLNETKEKYSPINTFNSSLYDDYINSINESKQQAYYDAYIPLRVVCKAAVCDNGSPRYAEKLLRTLFERSSRTVQLAP